MYKTVSCSEIVYPTPDQKLLSMDDPRLQTGKYEPLVHMNELVNEEVRRVMERLTVAPPHLVASSSLLSGALSKCLCCIQQLYLTGNLFSLFFPDSFDGRYSTLQ